MTLIISSGASEQCSILQFTVTHFRHSCTRMLSNYEHTHTHTHASHHNKAGHGWEGAWLVLPHVTPGLSSVVFHSQLSGLLDVKRVYGKKNTTFRTGGVKIRSIQEHNASISLRRFGHVWRCTGDFLECWRSPVSMQGIKGGRFLNLRAVEAHWSETARRLVGR